MKLSDIDFNDDACAFEKDYCFEFEDKVYEFCDFEEAKFRFVLDVDDYDYVTDKELEQKLSEHMKTL